MKHEYYIKILNKNFTDNISVFHIILQKYVFKKDGISFYR